MPPSTTCATRSKPWRCSRLAPTAARWPDEHRTATGRDEPRELGAEAGAQRGDRHRARDVRLVELQLGADVDDERAGGAVALDLVRRERVHVGLVDDLGAAIDRDDAMEVRRLGPERRE